MKIFACVSVLEREALTVHIVDLGLFGGTSEEAAKAAKEYIMREMNLRAATYADDAPEAKADVEFLGMETDAESNLIIVNFKLAY